MNKFTMSAYGPVSTESGSTTMPNVLKTTFGGSATALQARAPQRRQGFSFNFINIEIYLTNWASVPAHPAIATGYNNWIKIL